MLSAVRSSRGVYATITVAAGSQNFINYVLLNGLTYNDNPQGYDSQLLAGLAETHFVSGSDTITLKYSAQKGERVNFTVTSISAGFLDVAAVMGGKELNATNTTYSYSVVDVTAPASGELDLKITAKAAPKDSMFSVITNSNVPFKNCTVGVTGGGGGGLSAGGKAGVGVGVTAALLGLGGLGGYFAYKHFMGGGGGGNAVPPSGGESNTVQFGGDTGGEKMMGHTQVYPVDPMSHGLPPGDGGQGLMSHSPPNGTHPMAGPPGPQSLAPPGGQGGVPPTTAPMGPPPMSGMPPTGAPPTSGIPPTGAPAVPASHPMAFVPPLVPPNALNHNNTAPKDKGLAAPQSQSGPMAQQGDGQYQTMKDFQSGNFGQHMAPGQQPMGPNGTQPMTTGSPASQGFSSPTGPGAYPPAPQSQVPFGYGGEAHTMAPGAPSAMGQGIAPAPGSQMPFGYGADGTMHTLSPGLPSPMSPDVPLPGPDSQLPLGHGGQSMVPSSHAPTGTSGYPPAPSSQATPAPGSQMPFGNGGESVPMSQHPTGTGGYPAVPGSQATPTPGSQFAPGPESMQHHSGPNTYQNPMGQSTHGQVPGSNHQSFGHPAQSTPMSTGDGYTHNMGGPGGQQAVPHPMGMDPNFNSPGSGQPMSGADGFNHTMQSHMSPDSYHQNGTMGNSYHQSGQPMGPDSHHQYGSSPSPQGTASSPSGPTSTAPTGNPLSPQSTAANPSGADMSHSHPHGTDPPTNPSSQSHPDPNSQPPNPSGADLSHHTPDWTDYHDPDSCSCSEGPGPDSDSDSEGLPPTTTTTDPNPGFYMPGAPFRSPDKKPKEEGSGKHRHKRRRFPRLARGRVESHHHHAWTGRDAGCEDEECVFNRAEHGCDGRECGCKCRDNGCEVSKRGLRERRQRDGGLMS